MPKIEEKPAFWYDGKAYKTRLEAQKIEFNDLFQTCEIQSSRLFSETYHTHSNSITDDDYWKGLENKIEDLTEALQDLLCYRKTLLPLIEQETEQITVRLKQEQEKKTIDSEQGKTPDWGKTIEDWFSQHNAPDYSTKTTDDPEVA